jgi:tight adherence protein B
VRAASLAFATGTGVYLLYTWRVFGWRGVFARRTTTRSRHRVDIARLWRPAVALAVSGACLGWMLFGAAVPALATAGFVVLVAGASLRARAERRRNEARDSWPALIEEVRVRTAAAGRSIPQALFESASRLPSAMQGPFADARREWMLSTDFASTVAVLKTALRDATADMVCETLLVAHEVGGTDIDRRLAALVEDRIADLHGRKDAAARQAGVRFARRFVLVVPIGMALVGLTIGNGRAAYATGTGQTAVGVGVVLLAGCWIWSGRIMRLPADRRVFAT